MNKAILIGRLTADPEHKTTGGGTAYCRFTLAVSRRYTDAQGQRQADFIPVVAWRQLADLCHKYLAKGRRAGVVGEIQTRSYTAQDGTKRYVTEVVADEVEFLSPRAEGGESAAAQTETAPAAPAGYEEIEDDELPF